MIDRVIHVALIGALLLLFAPADFDIAPTPKLDLPNDGFKVLIIEETEQRGSLSQGQLEIVRSVPLRQWLANSGATLRVWDADIDASRESDWFKKAMAVPRTSLPWMVASNGSKQLSEPLPASVDAVKAEIGKLK